MSTSLSSGEVFEQAVEWYKRCRCAKSQQDWHPTRLIDLRDLKTRGGVLTGWDRLDLATVRIVEKGDSDFPEPGEPLRTSRYRNADSAPQDKQRQHNRYVTLSHCWGQHRPVVLVHANKARLKEGIKLGDLPDTYKEAIQFASRMEEVGWIWIDSLCIIQDDEKDWNQEASDMHRVYRESFLNISATASRDSTMGLYSHERVPYTLWEDEVNIKVDGINGFKHRPVVSSSGDTAAICSPTADITATTTRSMANSGGVRRCILVDASYWDDLVSHAPVNVRAWVLQERLLAPRVLHFCSGQIAWECGEFEESEGYPRGVQIYTLREDRIVPKPINKGIQPDVQGRELRINRLRGKPEPDPHLIGRGLYELELWSQIVEDYSKLGLTKAKDKLVALAGIAEYMATEVIGTHTQPASYCAGLWNKYLASQFLWRIEPSFRVADRTFQHLSRRPRDDDGNLVYRAPSFSWASVDAQAGQGVTYGEITDQGLLIQVDSSEDSVSIRSREGGSQYGEVLGGHILLWGHLRKATLSRTVNAEGRQTTDGRYCWYLQGREGICETSEERRELETEEHRNVYLDCPWDDESRILDTDDVYCMPAARGPRADNEDSKYIICLLLQHVSADDDEIAHLDRGDRGWIYRRIGLTKLSKWTDKLVYASILKPLPTDRDYPQQPHQYDKHKDGRSFIRLI